MDKLDLAELMIQQALEERRRLTTFEAEIKKIHGGPNYWEERYKVEKKYKPIPHKSVVNDSIKMARRYLLEAYM